MNLAEVHLSTRLFEDLDMDGDDFDVVIEVADRYGIDLAGYRWHHHSGMEGCNPLWFILPPWWMRTTHIPVRVADLVEAAESGSWPIEYPEEQVPPRQNWASVLLRASILSLVAFLLWSGCQ